MRVMHVITGLRTGGAENQLLLLTRHTSTDPMVVALTNPDEVATALRAGGVPVIDLAMRGNKDLVAIGRLTRLMRRYRPDVVHVHLYRATLYGRVAAGLARVPVVVTTEHSLLEGELEGRRTTTAVRTLYTATERFNDATLAVSDAVAGRLSRWGVPPAKVRVVPNAVDLRALRVDEALRAAVRSELGIPLTTRLIGGIGRLHRVKRWDRMIQALAAELGDDVQLLLVGSGEEESALRELAEASGVARWVHLPGARSDLAAVLSAMDVVVSPSPQETFGLSLVEAVAAGRPVVYVSSPGLEAVAPLQGATQVSEDPVRLREAVMETLREPAALASQSGLGRYDVRTVAQQVDEIYTECLQLVGQARRRTKPARDRERRAP
jgi:glycosyltransferase involved in cell wall biosynthesis